MELQILQRENQKLASITRLCIHLVDRCRTLNKTKQFIEDLSRLGILIDEFNHCNTKKNSQLPTFGNSGLVFDGHNTTTTVGRGTKSSANTSSNNINNQSTTATATMITTNNNNNSNTSGGGIGTNVYLIPIQMGPNQQGPQQYQLIQTTNDTTLISPSGISSKSKGKGKKGSSTTSMAAAGTTTTTTALMMMDPNSLNISTPQQQQNHQQQQQSILFKKLTESGQLQLIDSTMLIPQQQQTSTNNQQQQNHHQQISIPMNMTTASGGDQTSTIFSIIQQNQNIDQSNIENNNTGNIKRKLNRLK